MKGLRESMNWTIRILDLDVSAARIVKPCLKQLGQFA
jgi:hypothetical protein